MVWYGSLCCNSINYLPIDVATALFMAFGGPEISPLSFALQRASLIIESGDIFGLWYPKSERHYLLDRFVETRPRSWEYGLNRVQQRLLDASDQGQNYELTTLRESFARMRFDSLRISVDRQCPHLAKFEAETYWSSDATWRDTKLQIDWRALLSVALGWVSWAAKYNHYEASVEVFHSLLNCIDLQDSRGSPNSSFYESSPRAFLEFLHRETVVYKQRKLEEILTLRLQNMP